MAESKTFVFGQDANNGMLGLLAPLLQKQGLDPNMVMAMMNNRGGAFGGEGGWFMWVIFLFFLMGWGGNGFGGFGNRGVAGDAALGNLINNDNGRELLMQAIQGNANAISQLASTPAQFMNSLFHEQYHLISHIVEEYNINPFSEEAAYLAGFVGQRMYPKAKHFLCKCHCE